MPVDPDSYLIKSIEGRIRMTFERVISAERKAMLGEKPRKVLYLSSGIAVAMPIIIHIRNVRTGAGTGSCRNCS